jgi:hypothetical protein
MTRREREKLPCQLRDDYHDGRRIDGGEFAPSLPPLQGPMREGKTQQDSMPRDKRPRVKAWQERLEKARNKGENK